MKIAVMGGAGYIGSHTIIELYKAGHSVVVVDNLVNSSNESLRRVGELVGSTIPFINADVRDAVAMDKIFRLCFMSECVGTCLTSTEKYRILQAYFAFLPKMFFRFCSPCFYIQHGVAYVVYLCCVLLKLLDFN